MSSFDSGYYIGLLIGSLVSLPAIQRLGIWAVNDGIDTSNHELLETKYSLRPDAETGGAR